MIWHKKRQKGTINVRKITEETRTVIYEVSFFVVYQIIVLSQRLKIVLPNLYNIKRNPYNCSTGRQHLSLYTCSPCLKANSFQLIKWNGYVHTEQLLCFMYIGQIKIMNGVLKSSFYFTVLWVPFNVFKTRLYKIISSILYFYN